MRTKPRPVIVVRRIETEGPSDHSADASDHLEGFEPWGPPDA